MKITRKLDTVKTPDGGDMELFQHDSSFFIKINGQVLMDSRSHDSELELALLGCAHLDQREEPNILVGGLGLGFTVRQCLDMTGPDASVTVCELMESVIHWNHRFVGTLADHPLNDRRTRVHHGDIVEFLTDTRELFDAILLDVDNGPEAMTDSGNSRLYDWSGIHLCMDALKEDGCLAVWSSEASAPYELDLVRAGFAVRSYLASNFNSGRAYDYVIYVASRYKALLPRGGEELRAHRCGRKKESRHVSRKKKIPGKYQEGKTNS